jgi:CRP-like cAMP-binding protein
VTGPMAARISAQPFFAALTDTQRAALAEDGIAVTFAAGERLFDEGDIADSHAWMFSPAGQPALHGGSKST